MANDKPLTAEERKALAELCGTNHSVAFEAQLDSLLAHLRSPHSFGHWSAPCTRIPIGLAARLIKMARPIPRALATIEALEAALGADTIIAAPDGTSAKYIRCQESLVEGWLKAVLERDELLTKVADLERQLAHLRSALSLHHDCTARYGGGIGCSVCDLIAQATPPPAPAS